MACAVSANGEELLMVTKFVLLNVGPGSTVMVEALEVAEAA